MNSHNLRFHIQVGFKPRLTFNEIFNELKTAIPEKHPLLYLVDNR